jgi:predicted nucleic acid-binding protein
MAYIDSSSLLKLLWNEPESAAVRTAVVDERRLVVSALTELEVEVQLRARWLGGSTTKARYRTYRDRLAAFRDLEPFEFSDLSGNVFRRAIEQHTSSPLHCRTLDRLHLAAMDELGERRLLTNDGKQADAARTFGYEVIVPGSKG